MNTQPLKLEEGELNFIMIQLDGPIIQQTGLVGRGENLV